MSVCTNSGWVPENTRAPRRQFTLGDSGPFIRDYTLLSRHPKKESPERLANTR